MESTEEHKEVDESRNTMWRLATCGGDKNVRVSTEGLGHGDTDGDRAEKEIFEVFLRL